MRNTSENLSGLKTCSRCKKTKTIDLFYRSSQTKDGHNSWCKECSAAGAREYRARALADPEKRKLLYARNNRYYRRHSLRIRAAKYGLTEEELRQMIEDQKGQCAICPNPVAAIDHDKETGRVRGLLCTGCNLGIGHLRHDPQLLLEAASYCNGESETPG